MFKSILQLILKLLARLTIWRFRPKIIGITGSVGKTSTKEAISTVLSGKFAIRPSKGNYNNELGLPLTIIGQDSAGKNLFGWLKALLFGFGQLFTARYPQILVLEMGTDRPGDIAYLLTNTGKLECAVITDIGISHLEFFRNEAALAKEKLSLLSGLSATGTAVLNADNPKVLQGQKLTKKSMTYGFGLSDLAASDFAVTSKNGVFGISFKVAHKGVKVPFFIPNALGKPTAYACLAAAAVGMSFGINLVDCAQALEGYVGPAGRLRLLAGKNGTTVIDDSYNAAPSSTIAALEALETLPGRKLAAIGGMAELGAASEAGHREVAPALSRSGVQMLFLVGENTKIILDELKKKGFGGKVFWFADSDEAKGQILQNLQSGDCILIKGSQSQRMEKIAKALLADEKSASRLLVRQSETWLN